MDTIKAAGVSEGIGIGKAFVLDNGSADHTKRISGNINEESRRFHDAVESFCKTARTEAETLRSAAGDAEAEIMLGHISIAKDPVLLRETEKRIFAGQCAEEAFDETCGSFIKLFSSLGDEMTRQRASDIRDVRSGILSILAGTDSSSLSEIPEGSVLFVPELTPSMLAGIKKESIAAIVSMTGSSTSHSAILARVMEIPAVMGAEGITEKTANGITVIVDGCAGEIMLSPDKEMISRYEEKRRVFRKEKRALEAFRKKRTKSADGTEYGLLCNIGKPEDSVKVLECDGEGVGLFRTEFLFLDKTSAPSEEEQFTAYRRTALTLKDRPLIIRTLDIGGDKKAPCLDLPKEDNPFLGYRAIRCCLDRRELFRTQLRAILRASAFGNVRIMLPMITCVEEVRRTRSLIVELMSELNREGTSFNEKIQVGIMTETPASSAIADLLADESDFFSIGTNDLTGYTMCADRGNPRVSYLFSPLQPAVLQMIRRIIQAAKNKGIPVGMCGEAAADPLMLPLLISLGLDEFSVSPPQVLKVRRNIARWTKDGADSTTEKVMTMKTENEIREYLNGIHPF